MDDTLLSEIIFGTIFVGFLFMLFLYWIKSEKIDSESFLERIKKRKELKDKFERWVPRIIVFLVILAIVLLQRFNH